MSSCLVQLLGAPLLPDLSILVYSYWIEPKTLNYNEITVPLFRRLWGLADLTIQELYFRGACINNRCDLVQALTRYYDSGQLPDTRSIWENSVTATIRAGRLEMLKLLVNNFNLEAFRDAEVRYRRYLVRDVIKSLHTKMLEYLLVWFRIPASELTDLDSNILSHTVRFGSISSLRVLFRYLGTPIVRDHIPGMFRTGIRYRGLESKMVTYLRSKFT